jgi:hypothetical protein
MVYVIYERWFNREDLRDTLKNFPTIFGTIIMATARLILVTLRHLPVSGLWRLLPALRGHQTSMTMAI